MDQPTVLVISDDPEFPRLIAARWQSERSVPTFTFMSSDVCRSVDPETVQLVIVGRVPREALEEILDSNHASGKGLLLVAEDTRSVQSTRERWPGVTAIRQEDHWLETVILLAGEMLRRSAAESRAKQAETEGILRERQATLGRYMLEMRHTMNNALTAVLGNSELLLIEPGLHSPEVRAQIDTIRNMAVRMHEVLQRFSSLEKELKAVEPKPAKDSDQRERSMAVVQ